MNEKYFDLFEVVRQVDNPDVLRLIEALSSEKARNIELRREMDRLKRRIAEEDVRLSHAKR